MTDPLINIRHLNENTKVSMNPIHDLLYVDDFDLVACTEADMQKLMGAFELACRAVRIKISLKRTVVIYQPARNVLH